MPSSKKKFLFFQFLFVILLWRVKADYRSLHTGRRLEFFCEDDFLFSVFFFFFFFFFFFLFCFPMFCLL